MKRDLIIFIFLLIFSSGAFAQPNPLPVAYLQVDDHSIVKDKYNGINYFMISSNESVSPFESKELALDKLYKQEVYGKIVTAEFKRFDYKKIDELKQRLAQNGSFTSQRKDSTIDFEFTQGYKNYQLLEFGNDGEVFRKTIINENNSVEVYQHLTPFFEYYERYFTNGNIAVKAITSWLGFGTGQQYNFNKKGNLIEEKNWDIGYTFTFDDILEFCSKNEMNLSKDSEFPHRLIKVHTDNRKYWILEYCNSKDGRIDSFKIDAENGLIVLRNSADFARK